MARNEEKSLATLNRWTAQKRDLEKATNLGKSTYMGGALPPSATFGPYAAKKRPKIASEVDTIKECDHWRSEIVRGVAKKIAEIQNAALGEHRIRDLNDEINKDLREKGYWEDQIKALGGADYKAQAPKDVETYGAELASQSGYKYFGAAKDLPGVSELFDSEVAPQAPRKTKKQLFKNIMPDYYGWRDEEDGMLLLAEQEAEHEAVQKEVARWNAENEGKPKKPKIADAKKSNSKSDVEATKVVAPAEASQTNARMDFKAYVDVPTMDDIERIIIQKKKEMLLKRYATEEFQKQGSESSELLVGGSSDTAAK
mmetsp:Transcript_107925/g.305122  ORF Transcript_107925/g.305122 Transcript_107925/m.305122 type:complete len:313 (+) Transcript_107925:83-1021(+)|eukprot:CAMPEP_0179257958 /NCGR_PEP_ID=MMETSP0797-20121207/25065_1 /TAXON_ID=47934 /ORGANISM="Dinophysis acuminata, Strain DAEP01" /LENGTH=312 /DNA_ID=CAMNT_0020965969 /DNA_START=83 /DNA_END=1021 /DNA_ORIENTATION=+